MSLFESYPNKKITLDVIETAYKFSNYSELCELVMKKMDEGVIKPVLASGSNGKRPALYKAYWILVSEENFSELVEELNFRIHPRLKVGYYLNHLKQYALDRVFVLQLSSYLMEHGDRLEVEMSMNERCFEIWGREKFLQMEQGGRVLKYLDFGIDALNCYETAEPIAYFTVHRSQKQNVLIVENKDTFYSLRKHLLSGKSTVLGMEIGTLMYGAGKGVVKAFRYFEQSVEPYLLEAGHSFYYFGDLDYEGIKIYESLCEVFPCQPFVQAYEAMLSKCLRSQLPFTKEGQNRQVSGVFFNCFDEVINKEMLKILTDSRYIPQECLTINDF
ncbi:MAG TPA: hypothetical protein DCY20_09565 [Firmicutes bacterium]|nr:hypothetical protein [Bacillota bacterium]